MSSIFDNIPTHTIDFSKPIDTEDLLERLEDICNDAHKRQLERQKKAKAWWKNLTLEQADNFLRDLKENPKQALILDDGFQKFYPPASIILMKQALKEFIEMKKK